MNIAPGTQLGPYQITAALGAGGMGEVYRARDSRLGRDVAIKVLPAAFARDEERLRRFEQEAQAAAALDHPNILAIYQIGTHEQAPFIVSELLKGSTLRDVLREGPLPVRKAIDYAVQVARGLAAAHDRGIVHRDIKPDNIFITDDGRVKILDFGVAKLTAGEAAEADRTRTVETGAGTVLGTVGYMPPEQLRGQPVDARGDVFSLGTVLYEMLSGRRAFQKDSSADTMSAVLREDPPELSGTGRPIPPILDRIVRRAMEKNPQERFQSARDLAFALEDMTLLSSSGTHAAVAPASWRAKGSFVLAIAAVILLAAGVGSGFLGGLRRPPAEPPIFQRLTFRRGPVFTARFAPDGKTVAYGAAWDGNLSETYVATTESPESRSLGFPKTDLYAISSTGEVALSLRTHEPFPNRAGVLARVPLLGGAAPREVRDDVEFADWGPDGSIAATLDTGVGDRLEYPIGTVLYDSLAAIHHIRLSPDGSRIAFWEPDGGSVTVAVIDRAKKKTTLSRGWLHIEGLAWTPAGGEIWFSARDARGWGIFAVTLNGTQRVVLRSPGQLLLHDIAKDGRVLAARESRADGIRYGAPGSGDERDLSWHDQSMVGGLSADSRQLLFSEGGDAGGVAGAVYLRGTDGSPAVRLGDGLASALSPDGKWAVAITPSGDAMTLLPTGPGSPRPLAKGPIEHYWPWAAWLPDSRRVLLYASEPKKNPRMSVQPIDGPPRAIGPEGLAFGSGLSPDGRQVAATFDGKGYLVDIATGASKPFPAIDHKIVLAWSADGRSLLTFRIDIAIIVSKLDLASGKETAWKTFIPADRAGIVNVFPPHIAPDERSYAYTYERRLSELYVISGLK